MGRIVHFEIHASDPARAATFYTEAFGWEIEKWDGPMEYWMIKTGPKDEMGIDGGMMRRQGDAPTDGAAVNSFPCTLMVENLDESMEKVIELGGKEAVPKSAIPGMGWLGYCKDTEGNIFGMMQADTSAK